MKEVVEHLPGRTLDEVQQHEKWYQKFLTLEEKKKRVYSKLENQKAAKEGGNTQVKRKGGHRASAFSKQSRR